MAQKVDDPVLVVILAIIALLGVGLWKHLGKVADQKSALDMKRLEIEQMSVKKGQTMTSQPPPCQAANAAIEARLAARFSGEWLPLYSQVTFSHTPYHEALAAGRRQDAIMARVMDRPDIADVWDSDEVAEAAIALFRSPEFVG